MPSLSERLSSAYQRQFGRPASADDPQYATWIKTALPQMVQSDHDAYERSKRRWRVADKFAWAGVAAPFAAAAAPALLGGSAAASTAPAAGTSFWGGVTAPTFGAASTGAGAGIGAGIGAGAGAGVGAGATAARFGLTMGDLLKMGIGTTTSLLGQRSQNRALDRQLLANRYGIDRELEFSNAVEANRKAEADRVAAEDKRRYDAEQALLMEDRLRKQRIEDAREERRTQAYWTIRDLMRLGPFGRG